MTARTAYVVVDLGFGDAGKGRLVDALVRRHGASVVVRYSGGAQAGHTVVAPDGRAHTFSQIGAGTFLPGVRTLLGPAVVVHPTALAVELQHLARLGIGDVRGRLAVHRDVRLVTPAHQALGRLRELARGPAPHGSCGVGIGETVSASLRGLGVRLADLDDDRALHPRLEALVDDARRSLDALLADEGAAHLDTDEAAREIAALRDETLPARWAQAARAGLAEVRRVDDASARHFVGREAPLVFEGAQGVLLDEAYGFHPHTTWGRARTEDAVDLLERLDGDRDVVRYGVLRSYAVRHGAGPFPSEDTSLADLVEPHNTAGRYQGAMRRGRFDLVLARYALACTEVDAIALTHLDRLPHVAEQGVVDRYAGPDTESASDDALGLVRAPDGSVVGLQPRSLSLEDHERRTEWLRQARGRAACLTPDATRADGFCAYVEAALGKKVGFRSSSPHATGTEFSTR